MAGVGLKPLRWPRADLTLFAALSLLRSLDFARDDIIKRDDGGGGDGQGERGAAEVRQRKGRQRKGRERGRFFDFVVF